ncbi:MAG: 6-hydroxymethylpterin diphosphokinase MptE-like protein, partial [Planctomycetota bacterium]
MRDLDRRFTLPEDAPWLANLAALWSVNPSLARRVELAAEHREQAESLPAKPQRETVHLPDDTRLGEHFAFALQGFGPHVNELFERTGGEKGETILVVLEPDLLRVAGWLASENFAGAIESGRVVFFDTPDIAAMQNVFGGVSLVVANGFDVCANEAAQQRCGDSLSAMAAALQELSEHHRTHLNTTVRFGRKSVENLLANLDHFVSAPGIERLAGAAEGRPAVLVSAGPSLRKNIERLRGMEDRVVIIAVQTTLRPLLDAGVTPHFVCAIDHHEISTRFYENLPAD